MDVASISPRADKAIRLIEWHITEGKDRDGVSLFSDEHVIHRAAELLLGDKKHPCRTHPPCGLLGPLRERDSS